MALRLLHFADLHLDRSFAGQRLFGIAAQRRREDLRAALLRIIERAQRAECDLITCGGDLFEHLHVTRDTATFVADTLGGAGRPVLIAPGNCDPALPSSPYRYLRWPHNVTIATHEELRPYRFGAVQVWAAGFMRSDVTHAPLKETKRLENGPHLLLLHASDMTALPEGKTPYAPIVASQVQDVGFAHALLGHFHRAQSGTWITYPGSPEPLGWDEPGPHCTALVTVRDDGSVEVVLEPINQRQFVQETIDVTGMTSPDQVRDAVFALRASKRLDGAILRATLVGERAPSLQVDPQALALESSDGFAFLEFRDQSRIPHDLDALAQEFTSRGEMVRKLVEHRNGSDTDATAGRAIQLALDAFEA